MKKHENDKTLTNIDFVIDITEDVCPLTFVKTKLQLERMSAGQILEVRLRGREPLENVPRSVTQQGDTVLSLEALDGTSSGPDAAPDLPHRLIIRKE
ncbi:MAG: sulfurtransferase TusA family protein [Rhodospirillales bacterium]|nr:sulfurtransferase TusA family protein [Rhodospirillales bacterium]